MVKPIRIYASEINDGLADQIINSKVSADCCLVSINDDNTPLFSEINCRLEQARAKQANFDLYPIYSVLVSTGWNKNDDVFDLWETYSAKDTPEDKPFNLEHDPNRIIGHITGGWPVNDDLELVAAKSEEELPDRIHLLTSAVIYKHINSKDETLEEKTKQLIASIADNEWFVSMEALFSDFDYAMTCEDGTQKVVARNSDTAFLTKHLRVYGGKGVYNGKRIGRLLRNITFAGNGLVKKPANPASVIFNDTNMFKGVFASVAELNEINNEVMIMENSEKLQLLEKQYADAQGEIKSLRDRLTQMDEARVQAEIKSFKDDIDAKIATIAAKDQEIASLTASLNATAKTNEELTGKLVGAEKLASEANERLIKIEQDSKVTARISTLVDRGVEKAQAEVLVQKAGDMNDEQFGLLVEAYKKPEVVAETVDTTEAVVDPTDVVEEETSPSLGTSTDNVDEESVNAARAELRDFLGNLLN